MPGEQLKLDTNTINPHFVACDIRVSTVITKSGVSETERVLMVISGAGARHPEVNYPGESYQSVVNSIISYAVTPRLANVASNITVFTFTYERDIFVLHSYG